MTSSIAHARSQAAIVIVSTGDFYAVNKSKHKRSLSRRSKIYVGDTLVTGDKGRGQVRFVDGAIISLRPDTKLRIDDYRYGNNKANENSVMTLIKGGFRTITGAIGKENYKVISSMATIGIRGTHYEAVMADGQMYVALWDGGVTIKNNGGEIDLGLGASYDFAQISSKEDSPKGLSNPPAAILNDSQPNVATETSKATKTNQKNDGTSQIADSDMADETTLAESVSVLSLTEDTFIDPVSEGTINSDMFKLKDTLDFVGFATGNFGFVYGDSTSGADGSPFIKDRTLLYAVLQGNATLVNTGSASVDGGNTSVYWGAWDNSSGTASTLIYDPDGTPTETGLASTIYWITMNPTQNMPTTGTKTYTNVVAALGSGTGGDLNGFSFNASVDFASASINGQMGFDTGTGVGANTWYVDFTGSVRDSKFDVAVNTITSNVNGGTPIDGDIAAVFTGTNAEAVGGGFNLKAITSPSLEAQGVFVVSQ
ncbi:MAG: FecR family protein [Gammaproteobacteria bacterium]|nr:FecR family protein [Gammaproteobacteria bacterium]